MAEDIVTSCDCGAPSGLTVDKAKQETHLFSPSSLLLAFGIIAGDSQGYFIANRDDFFE